MTFEIGLVLVILLASLVLFVTEWLRMDVVALLVLGALAVSGLVTAREALSGFSNPAVITVWAMFILSAGLSRTGVAEIIGRRMLGWVGRGEPRMIAVIMLTSGGLSAFMNNIGVAALMLPVVLDVARRTGRPPSRLLMPLAYGSLLGGLTTLIGTPPNILAADSLREEGFAPFGMFDFTPVGGAAMLAGIVFLVLVGRRILPVRDPGKESAERHPQDLTEEYALDEKSTVMRVPAESVLSGRTLAESRLGSATGLNVYAILREGQTRLAPGAETVLQSDDQLLVEGTLDRINELRGWRELILEERDRGLERLASTETGLTEVRLLPDSGLAGQTLRRIGFRGRFGIVLALRRGESATHSDLANTALRAGDRLLVQSRQDHLRALRESEDFEIVEPVSARTLNRDYDLRHRIFIVRVPRDSRLIGKSLAKSRLSDALGLGVLGLVRDEATQWIPDPEESLRADDRLLVRGAPDALQVLRGLRELEIDNEATQRTRVLESDEMGLLEVALSPRTSLAGKTLSELAFRERFGFRALAIQHEGRTFRTGLADRPLSFGDALLLLGPREKVKLLSMDPDFLVLTQSEREIPDTKRAPLAALIMAGVLLPVLMGWLPIAIAAIIGATVMVVSGCTTMEHAYRSIEWQSVFLIAGMLPLGIAMQASGAASFLADGVLAAASPLGPWGIVLALYLTTALATAIIPTAALVVLMAPIAFKASAEMGMSPHAVMMAVAMAASASFTSPVSHPANVLIMGPGGYRFVDYVKLGVPLTLVVLVVVLVVLPFVWPFYS